jgi:hypothetical protein
MANVPEAVVPDPRVLADAVLESMKGDRLVAAVFLSFQFAPEYFEDSILAPLCGVENRGSPAIRRLLLEERLRELEQVLVLYDHAGLEPDGPLRQEVRAVPVAWSRGVVHAKHALLLVERKGDTGAPRTALILLTTSANMTRTGWGQNVEIADIERLEAGATTSLRGDLLGLVGSLRRLIGADEQYSSLERIGTFIRDRLTGATGLPRLWLGHQTLAEFLVEHIGVRRGRIELIAPFVDDTAAPVRSLADALSPAEVVVWFPRDRNDLGAAPASWRDGVRSTRGAGFGDLRLDRSLGKGSDGQRFVHAKVIRVVDPATRRTWTLAGSPNLSQRGHAGWQTSAPASNVETAMLRVAVDGVRWLEPLDAGKEPGTAERVLDPKDEDPPGLLVRVRFDWETRQGALRLSGTACEVWLGPSTSAAGDSARARVEVTASDAWVALEEAAAGWLCRELQTGNVIAAWSDATSPTSVLVEEHGGAHRPSMVARELSAADILRHWSLLSEAQRAANLEKRLDLGGEDPEAPSFLATAMAAVAGPTMFDTFSGIIHGYLVLKLRLEEALRGHQDAAVEAWLLGSRHDSVGTLLDKVLQEPAGDPVRQVVFALCSRELLVLAETRCPQLLAARPTATEALRKQIEALEAAWEFLDSGGAPGEHPDAFRQWLQRWWQAQVEVQA